MWGGPKGLAASDNDHFFAKGDGSADTLWGGTPKADSGAADRARVDLLLDHYKPKLTYGIEVWS